MEAFSPSEAHMQHLRLIPDAIIGLVNMKLSERYGSFPIVIEQEELTNELRLMGISEEDFLDRGWSDFEPLYSSRGWHVAYSRPDGRGRWEFTERGEREN